MEKNNKLSPYYVRVIRSNNSPTEKLLNEQLNPVMTHNPQFKKERVKKVKKSWCVDSSYYLG